MLVDAFVIRATLVPAFMRLAGDANWWAPRWLRRIHDRIGISEHVDLDDHGPACPTRSRPVDLRPPTGDPTLAERRAAATRLLTVAVRLEMH